jgi:signal transduction histidine kinase
MSATWNEVRKCLLESQEAERQRLAQELHDGPVQELHSLDFDLVAFGRTLPDGLAREHWATMRSTLLSISRQLRVICQNLRPPALGPFGLSVVLHSSAENFEQLFPNTSVELDVVEDGLVLPPPVRLTYYRICQEALRNIAQHAEAQHVRIELALADDAVTMAVEDDGHGFTVPPSWIEWASAGKLGLFQCAQYAEAINGNLQVQSTPGQGVRILVNAPLAR